MSQARFFCLVGFVSLCWGFFNAGIKKCDFTVFRNVTRFKKKTCRILYYNIWLNLVTRKGSIKYRTVSLIDLLFLFFLSEELLSIRQKANKRIKGLAYWKYFIKILILLSFRRCEAKWQQKSVLYLIRNQKVINSADYFSLVISALVLLLFVCNTNQAHCKPLSLTSQKKS